MIKNNRVLVIKLSPVKGLNSSMMRALAIVKGLVEEGYRVDMLTLRASASHVINNNEYSFLESVDIIYANPNKVYDSIVSGAEVGIKKRLVNGIRMIYHATSLFDYTASIAKKLRIDMLPSSEYEYLIAISDPKTTHIATRSLLKQGLRCGKIIEYWGDPLYGDITLKSKYPDFVYKRIEKNLLSLADKIVYTSPLTLADEQRLYPDLRNRMTYTPTPYLEAKYLPPKKGKYTVGYYGAYPTSVRNIIPLYNACKNIGNLVDLVIVGNSDLSLEETDSIKVHPRGDIGPFEETTDLFICILNLRGAQIPGKLYHYAAYNRPILVIEDGERAEEMHEYVSSFNRYYTCNNDVDQIQQRIMDIMHQNKKWTPLPSMSPKHVVRTILE